MLDFSSALYKILGDRIKDRRDSLGMSQTNLSEELKDLKRASISNIEKGRQHPPLDTIYRLCEALRLDIHTILPTYSEVLDYIEKNNSDNKIERFLDSLDVEDKLTFEKIKNLLNKDKK
ncbi:hypothetical protein DI487_13330 [Flavobacterium sediminis]|uniref:HTH cro/C1-type domain-containing protein n=1 Tax=Flavobacterium sediminis TaxID=2201181 RepID=A0A2U8QX02_9FLAO|nr:helix-turn-helix transcriptional regulator [Flavobacterium sediminis]AWM14742.1 hypothetical protein DI487_13330 [Flavobacterium sediminis]